MSKSKNKRKNVHYKPKPVGHLLTVAQIDELMAPIHSALVALRADQFSDTNNNALAIFGNMIAVASQYTKVSDASQIRQLSLLVAETHIAIRDRKRETGEYRATEEEIQLFNLAITCFEDFLRRKTTAYLEWALKVVDRKLAKMQNENRTAWRTDELEAA